MKTKLVNRFELDVMPYDKVFIINGQEQLCSCTGYMIIDSEGSFWNEYIDNNGCIHYGR